MTMMKTKEIDQHEEALGKISIMNNKNKDIPRSHTFERISGVLYWTEKLLSV